MSTAYTLAHGTHATPEEGVCAMEWVSHIAGEAHTDQPRCVSPLIRVFCVTLNDGLDEDHRQRLRLYLSRTIGTADDGLDEVRGWMALDWLIRTYTPMWLSAAGLRDPSERLRVLPAIAGSPELAAARPALVIARRQSRKRLRSVAGSWLSRSPVALAAGRRTASTTAADAAWAAARVGLSEIAAVRAQTAVRATAGNAATALLCAARATGAASPRAGLHAGLFVELRERAFELLDRMLPLVSIELPISAQDGQDACHSAVVPGKTRRPR